jgi:hypothetical protein
MKNVKIIIYWLLSAVLIVSVSKCVSDHYDAPRLQREAQLQSLRKTDAAAYLSELKTAHDPRWEAEYKELDPSGYEVFRTAEISKLNQELKTRPSADRQLEIFQRLTFLDPTNQEYKKRHASLSLLNQKFKQSSPDEKTTSNSGPQRTSPNAANDRLLAIPEDQQAIRLGRIVGEGCIGKDAFYRGIGKSGFAKNKAFWAVRCTNGKSYAVTINTDPNGSGSILDCSALKATTQSDCFQKLKD